jgi:hypothetical protein
MRRLAFTFAFALAVVVPASASAQERHEHSGNMTHLKNLSYEARNGTAPNGGTDIEFARLAGKQYALAGSYMNGMQIVDISRPARSQIAAVYDCGVTQGDVQVFTRDDLPGRTFATYTSDTTGDGTSTCYREAAALGFDVLKPTGKGKNGTFIVEVTNPLKPKTISFAEVPQGSHNQTVHPSGRYMYNSNSDLITSALPAIEVIDLTDLSAPKTITELALPTRPGLGTESHDISFNASGTRAYSAALSQGVIIDTRNPAEPQVITSFLDPAINVWHQAEPFTLTDEFGQRRDFLIVEDEFAGALGTGQCPNGGVHVYEISGGYERDPRKVGYWNIDTVGPTDAENGADGRCTAHVFDIHEDAQIMTIAYYNGGVHVVDLSGLTGISLGGTQLTGDGMKGIGSYRIQGMDSWSAKTPRIDPSTGDFHLYGNDQNRGLDVYRFDGEGQEATSQGTWMTPLEALALAQSRPQVEVTADNALLCLLPQ